MHIAHIDYNGNRQTCEEHCKNVALYASEKVELVGLKNSAYLAGLLHDMGKFSDEFDRYINDSYAGKNVKKGSVIHTFAGLSYLFDKFYKYADINSFYENITVEILSYVIASHHGLFDCIDEDGKDGFSYRITKQPSYDRRTFVDFENECVDGEKIEVLFCNAVSEIGQVLETIAVAAIGEEKETNFYIGLLMRLILSAVIDGDRKDTYQFVSGQMFPVTVQNWDIAISRLNKYMSGKEKVSAIQRCRSEMSEYCYQFAENESGIYRLNMPTGSGKTLSSLRYALKHSQIYNMNRIIYVAPLISILEQNAEVIKEAIGSEMVLEHHSNVINEAEDDNAFSLQLLTENWDSPVIVTTLVQFLNTLFDGRTSSIRRMSALVKSVIIIDEVQTVPQRMLSLFNLAINFLHIQCGACVLLCSATQPAFDKVTHSMKICSKNLIPIDKSYYYYEVFKRCKIVNAGKYRLEEVPRFILDVFSNTKSLLVVCNKKKEAEYLFNELCSECECYHLSASMCMEHRRNTLSNITLSLNDGGRIMCVSTQVIEAGVDISFEKVIRFSAGIDNIVQAAGRCNRNGELGKEAVTYIIDCVDEKLKGLDDIKRYQDSTRELIYDYEKEPNKFKEDLSSDASINHYYECLFRETNRITHFYDYQTDGSNTIFEMLSSNDDYVSRRERNDETRVYCIQQAFKTAGECFKVLETDTITIVVPYMDGRNIIEQLCSEESKYDLPYANKLLKELKKYSVSIMRYQFDWLRKENAIYEIFNNSIYVLMEEYYDANTGVVTERKEHLCDIQIL